MVDSAAASRPSRHTFAASAQAERYRAIAGRSSGPHRRRREDPMDHTYKISEIVGSSPDGVDSAIRNGITRASKTLRNLDWFEVTDIRGAMNDGDIAWFQVTMKVGFRLEDGD
jgi:flavin-binding protein dodecin